MAEQAGRLRFWRRVTRVLQAALAVSVFLFVWLIGFRDDSGPAPVVPDTEEQFSLDLSVLDTADHDLVYAVEQRARPSYRIFSFDPSTGVDTTVYTVPEDEIIYGLDLSPDGSVLAVAYSTDYQIEGSGLSLLDLDTGLLSEVTPATDGIYLAELEWAADGSSVYATHVDRSGDDEQLGLAEVDLETGTIDVFLDDAITPAVADDGIYYLTVADDLSRRSIGLLDDDGESEVIAFAESDFDLDHLVAGVDTSNVNVAVLNNTDDGGLTVGSVAEAHGNHNVASTWWDVTLDDGGSLEAPTAVEPIIVYDAVQTDEAIVYATLEGLSIAWPDDGTRVDLIASRALRFVTG